MKTNPSASKHFTTRFLFIVIFVMWLVLGIYFAWGVIPSFDIVPSYKPIERIIIIFCGLGWAVWGIYGFLTVLRTIPTWVKVFCTIIFSGVFCVFSLIIAATIEFDTDNYCHPNDQVSYVCIYMGNDSMFNSHLYLVQSNGIFMDYVGTVTPTPRANASKIEKELVKERVIQSGFEAFTLEAQFSGMKFKHV